ncbi:MAG TPA: dihydrolipoamide acetyltransferase family protein [Thermoanaerobaculia bacterium]
MAEIIMPKMGDAMTEGKVIRWYKKQGDAVKKGEPVAEIETDKVNLDLEAEDEGTLGAIAAQEGEVVQVGGLLARILAEGEADEPAEPEAEPEDSAEADDSADGEDAAEVEDTAKDEESAEPEGGKTSGDKQKPAAARKKDEPKDADPKRRATDRKDSIKHTTGEYAEAIEHQGHRRDRTAAEAEPEEGKREAAAGERRPSSPLARKMAAEMGVSLDSVKGSGPRGRIVAADVKNAQAPAAKGSEAPARADTALSAGIPSLETTIIPLTAMRRTIAKRLGESTGPIPHFYLTSDFDVTDLVALRQQMIDVTETKISLNDFVIRAIALALHHHPAVNASWGEEAITQHGEVHIGVAVATPEGLITPVIRNADQKSVPGIAAEVRALAGKAKNRRLKPDEYQGSTFTISNLGAWGIEEFTAIINPPNVAILAIGAAEPRPVVDANRQIIVRERMKVTMSCDHRVVDGATGADFMKTLRKYIEQPLRLVL